MQFFRLPHTRYLTVLAQDPSLPVTTKVPVFNEALEPGPSGHRLRVIDYDASTNRFVAPYADPSVDHGEGEQDIDRLVANPYFHAQNVFAIASSVLLRFEAALGRHVQWGFDGGAHQLKIAPHAFLGANAFYSCADEALAFGYFPRRGGDRIKGHPTKRFVFTCLSYDIVAHETTHAVLDGLRREFDRPSSPDQAALHEALADIVALLSAFSSQELIRHVLPPSRAGKGRLLASKLLTPKALKETALVKLAEEMGRDLSEGFVDSLRGDALRKSASIKPTGGNYDALRRVGEEHDLGELLVAAVLNAFIEVWSERALRLDPMKTGLLDRELAIEEGTKAAEHLLTMSIRAVDYLPPVNVEFPDFVTGMLTADREAVRDDRLGYRPLLLKAFAAYGISPVKSKELGYWNQPEDEPVYGFDGHAEMRWDREAVARFLWENSEPLKLTRRAYTEVVSVRPVRRHSAGGFVLRETVAEYLQILDLQAHELARLGPKSELRKPEGVPDWQRIRLLGGGTLIFDDYGRLKFHIGTNVLHERQNDRLSYLAGRDLLGAKNALLPFAAMHRRRAFRRPVNYAERW